MDEIEKSRTDLKGSDPKLRADAAERLCISGPGARIAAVDLVQACDDDDETVRTWAAAALEDLGPPPKDSIERLLTLVTNEQSLVAYWAVTLLGRLGTDAFSSESVLANILTSSPHSSVREQAAWSLGKIGVKSKVAATALERAKHDGSARLARLAEEALLHSPT